MTGLASGVAGRQTNRGEILLTRTPLANTGAQCGGIKGRIVEIKVVIVSAVQKHGFVFNSNDCQNDCSSSSEPFYDLGKKNESLFRGHILVKSQPIL